MTVDIQSSTVQRHKILRLIPPEKKSKRYLKPLSLSLNTQQFIKVSRIGLHDKKLANKNPRRLIPSIIQGHIDITNPNRGRSDAKIPLHARYAVLQTLQNTADLNSLNAQAATFKSAIQSYWKKSGCHTGNYQNQTTVLL